MKLYLIAWLVRHGLPGWLTPDYATMVGVAGIVGSVLVLRFARRDGESAQLQARALLTAFVAALLGGYVFEWIRAIPEAAASGSLTPIVTAGRAAYGGLIAGIVVPALYLQKRGASVRAFFDRATLAMGTLFCFVRVGCFLEGCDFGQPTASWLGVRFPAGSPAAQMHAFRGWVPEAHASLPVHATELYEAALGVLASALALVWLRRGRRDGAAFVTWIATYAAGRLLIESLRGDVDRGVYAGLSTAQLVSIAMLAACAFAVLGRRPAVRASTAVVVAALAIGGCVADSAPPLGELTLRDALSADPAVVAALRDDEREALRRRFDEAAHTVQPVETAATAPSTAGDDLAAIDELRRGRGADAMLIAALDRDGAEIHARSILVDAGASEPAAPASTALRVEGPPPSTTRDAELRALDGDAGRILRALVRDAGASHVVRVVGWPAAIVIAKDSVFVNAAWLVAMDPGVSGLPLAPLASPSPQTFAIHPLVTLGGQSLDQCVNPITFQCSQCLASDAGSACEGATSLTDLSGVRDECTFFEKDNRSVEELCALYFLQDPDVAACVATVPGCAVAPTDASSPLTSTNLASAAAFVASSNCVVKLDACLGGSGGGGGGGTTTPPPAMTSSGCGCDCDKCCSDKGCGQLACKDGTGTCGKFCTDGQCKQCAMQPREGPAAPKSPWGLVCIVPLLYLLRAARRVSGSGKTTRVRSPMPEP